MIYGLIAEYNPLHEGHRWQINYIKEVLGADALVLALSGDFTQRGIPAVRPGFERAQWALDAGADLVTELPVLASTGSAETFARGGVALLKSLGIVDRLVFSAETPKTEYFDKAALLLNLENEAFKQSLKECLKSGTSYPKARGRALGISAKEPLMEDFLSTPNNILGVEYVRAILATDGRLDYLPLQRQPGFLSSTEIRKSLSKSDYIHPGDFSLLIHRALISGEDFSDISDIEKALSNRIIKMRDRFTSPEDFSLNHLKSKNYTYSRLLRILFHILLEIKNDDIKNFRDFDYAPYARVLGVKKGSEYLLSKLSENAVIPVLKSHKEAVDILSPKALSIYKKDLYASDLYRIVYNQKNPESPLINIRSEALRNS